MDVIPVIDVQHGRTVRAARGERASYQPIETPLAEGCAPVAVALGLRSLFAFPTLYIADLDASRDAPATPLCPSSLRLPCRARALDRRRRCA